MTGTLYGIPTPIGNKKDMTQRAKETLSTLDLLLCEDTRHTGALLKDYEIQVPLMSYHKFNEMERIDQIMARIAKGEKIGLVSDAGLPGISDPGERIIAHARKEGVSVEVLPGPSAGITALVGSGIQTAPHLMHGFLSKDNGERKKQVELLQLPITHILYESPKRVRKTVRFLYETLGNRPVCLCRELTKIHEEYLLSTLEDLLNDTEQIKEKGEYVIIIGPVEEEREVDVERALRDAMERLSLSAAVKEVSKTLGLPKNEVYEQALTLKGEADE